MRRGCAALAALAALSAPAPARAQDWLEMRDLPPARELSLVDAAARDRKVATQLHALFGLTATANDGLATPRPLLERVGTVTALTLSPRRWLVLRTETEAGVTLDSAAPIVTGDVSGSHQLRARFAFTEKESRGKPVVEAFARLFGRHAGRLGGMMLDAQFGRRSFWDVGAEVGVFAGRSLDRTSAVGALVSGGIRAAGFAPSALATSFDGRMDERWVGLGAGVLVKEEASNGVLSFVKAELHHHEFSPGVPAYVRPAFRVDARVLDAPDLTVPISKREVLGVSTSFGWSFLFDGATFTETPIFRLGGVYSAAWDRLDGWVGATITRELVPLADGSSPLARTRFEGSIRANLKRERLGVGATHVLEHRELWVPGRADLGDRGFVFAIGGELWASPIRSLIDVGLVYTGGNNCPMSPTLGTQGACHQFGGFARLRADTRTRPGD